MIPSVLISSLCWVTRNFQNFRGRWKLVDWLSKQKETIESLKAGPVSVGRGYRIWSNPRDLGGFRYYINGINPREPISKIFFAILKPGDCVIDIGANVGYFSILGSMLTGPNGIVHAFEASPDTAEQLKVATQNPNRNIKIHPVAVSDHHGQIEFSCGPINRTGISSIRSLGTKEAKRISVPCVPLDEYFNDLASIKLIKIDVEGAELLALRGMKQLLQRARPYVVLELTDKWLRELGGSAEELLDFMKSIGYTAYQVTDLSHPLASTAVDQTDILFVPLGAVVLSAN
jgi:FkbM family methyltransferase